MCVSVCVCCMRACASALAVAHSSAQSACACVRACMCLYASECMWLPALLECACVCMSHGGRGSWSSDWVGRGAGMAEEPFPFYSTTHQTLFLAIPGNPGASKEIYNKRYQNYSEGQKTLFTRGDIGKVWCTKLFNKSRLNTSPTVFPG